MVRYLSDDEKKKYNAIAEVREKAWGKWMQGNMPTYGGYKCSICGWQTVEYKLEKCRWCGTKMHTKYVGYKEKKSNPCLVRR